MPTELDYMEYANDVAAQAAYITNGHHAITFHNTAELDTAEKKWGSASLLLDGDSDYLTIPNSDDWDIVGSSTDDWTIDFWVKHTDHAGAEMYMRQLEDGSNQWYFFHSHGNGIKFAANFSGGTPIAVGYGGEIIDNDWHHIALCKVGNDYGLYVDGDQVASDMDNNNTDAFTGSLWIGSSETVEFFDGHIDEIRIIKSNIFSAAPAADDSNTITKPTLAHQTDTDTKLLLHLDGADEAQATVDWSRLESRSEDTVVQQGTYSLGCFANTDAINDTLTRTVDPTIDLSDLPTVYFHIKQSNIAGSIKIGIHDDGGTTTEKTVTVAGHAITFNVTAELDTAEKKWGTASLLLDGDSDYLSIPDSADWDVVGSNSDDWTVDLFVKHDDHAGSEYYITHWEDMNNRWVLNHDSGLWFFAKTGGDTIIALSGAEISDTEWHHVALIKVADEYGLYLDGSQGGYVQDSSTDTYDGSLLIGTYGGTDLYFDGHMDDIRVIHSNIFGAAPNDTPNDTIDVPTGAHTGDADTKLLLHLDGADEATTTIDASRDYWQAITWDISGVANGNKDVIDSIIVTILNADNDNTFYLDNMYALEAAVGFMLGCNF